MPIQRESSGVLQRIGSIDAFRGLTMGAMVVVNNPGSWSHVYSPLRHADWHGCTPTDLIFPFFLFAVGAAIAVSKSTATDRSAWLRMLRRSLILFGLGLLLNASSMLVTRRFDLSHLRIMGVLQRIAICYALAFSVTRLLRPAGQAMLAGAVLLAYAAALLWVPFPGRDAAQPLSMTNNLCGWVDRSILGVQHLYKQGAMDPEGLLSTLPATVTTLMGFWAGRRLLSSRDGPSAVHALAWAGLLLVFLGWLWHARFGLPLNKQLWTSSYTLFSAGCSSLVLWACVLIVDRAELHRLSFPVEVLGRNAILLFVGSGILARLLSAVRIPADDGRVRTLSTWIYEAFYVPWAGTLNGSLAYALTWLGFWWVVLYVCWRRKWLLKV
ncbi:MAG: acyltransferase family protein [Phycisphaerales bacterium]